MIYNNPNDYWQGQDPYKGMNDDERMGVGCMQAASVIVGVVLGLLLCALLSSCSTQRVVTVERKTTDTLLCYSSKRDSVYLRDSIFVTQQVAGDTVRITTNRWHTKFRDRLVTDTIYRAVRDTVPVPYTVEKKVKADLTWWQESRLMLANIVLIILAVLFLFKGLKFLKP
jgi:PhoPQ-activated pathogenicity-related protein